MDFSLVISDLSVTDEGFVLGSPPHLNPVVRLEPVSATPRRYEMRTAQSRIQLEKEVLKGWVPGTKVSVWAQARRALRAIDAMQTHPNWHLSTTSSSNYLSNCVSSNMSSLGMNFSQDFMFRVHEFGILDDRRTASSRVVIDDCVWNYPNSDLGEIQQGLEGQEQRHAVFSIPKSYGLQFGALVFSVGIELPDDSLLSPDIACSVLSSVVQHSAKTSELERMRQQNFSYLAKQLEHVAAPYFVRASPGPGAAVLRIRRAFDEVKFKEALHQSGVYGTSFFGNQGIVLPCHPLLDRSELEYIAAVSESALNVAGHT